LTDLVVKRARPFLEKNNVREKKSSMDDHNDMNNTPATDQFDKQSLTEHLRDLRSCLIVSLIATTIGFAAAYAYITPIGTWFFKPLTDVLPKETSLIFTSYQEGFFFI
jgi:Sec-independent protein secretion pathway component TatC